MNPKQISPLGLILAAMLKTQRKLNYAWACPKLVEEAPTLRPWPKSSEVNPKFPE